MKNALEDAQLTDRKDLKGLGQVNCHSTSTNVGDIAEARAIDRLFGADSDITITALKSSLGHTFGAAGAIETILGIRSL